MLEVRKKSDCKDCCEDIFRCVRCDYSLLSLKPVKNIDINELNVLAEKEANKCRTIIQDEEYYTDCVECYKSGFYKAVKLLCE